MLAVLVATAACSSGTGPDGVGTESVTHPAGIKSDKITFDTSLLGVAVAPSGVAYVSTDPAALGTFTAQSPYTKLSSVTTGAAPRDIVIDRAGTTAYAATDKGTVYVVDLKTATMKATLFVDTVYRSGDARNNLLAIAADGSRAYLITDGQLWSLPTNGAPAKATGRRGSSIAVSPATGSIYLTSSDGGQTARVDPSTFVVQTETTIPAFGSAVAVTPRGDEVYVGGNNGVLHVLDPTTLAERAAVTVPSNGISGISVSPDGSKIYVTMFDVGLTIIDRATRTILSTISLGGLPLGVAFDPQGTTAFVVNYRGWVDVIR